MNELHIKSLKSPLPVVVSFFIIAFEHIAPECHQHLLTTTLPTHKRKKTKQTKLSNEQEDTVHMSDKSFANTAVCETVKTDDTSGKQYRKHPCLMVLYGRKSHFEAQGFLTEVPLCMSIITASKLSKEENIIPFLSFTSVVYFDISLKSAQNSQDT